MNSWNKCTRQRFALFPSSCHLLQLFSSNSLLLSVSLFSPSSPPFFTFFSLLLLSICSCWLCFTRSLSRFPRLLFLYPCCASLPLPLVISCTEQLFHFPLALHVRPAILLLYCYFFSVCLFQPFSLLSQRGNLENFISPFFSVRQETTSIFLWKRQGL